MTCSQVNSYFLWLLLLSLLIFVRIVSARKETREHERIILSRLLEEGTYDSRIRPYSGKYNYGDDNPVVVTVSVYIADVLEEDAANSEVGVHLIVISKWKDERLNFEAFKGKTIRFLSLTDTAKVWTPDIGFCRKADVKVINGVRPILIRLMPDGDIIMKSQIVVKMECSRDFVTFPMDFRTCELVIKSNAYTVKDILLDWDLNNPVECANKSLMTTKEYFVREVYKADRVFKTSLGKFSGLKVSVNLDRHVLPYVLKVYVPCIVLLLLAWSSSCWPSEAVLARIMFLAVVYAAFLFETQVLLNLPRPRYHCLTALDTWFIACFLFLLFVTLQYAVVLLLRHRELMHSRRFDGLPRMPGEQKDLEMQAIWSKNGLEKKGNTDKCSEISETEDQMPSRQLQDFTGFISSKKLDCILTVSFLPLFLVFNAVYWGLFFSLRS